MKKLTAEKFCNILKYIEQKRQTFYSNVFPYNCGYIYANKSLSFDCINLIKSVINNPDIATKTKPVGYYVKPGIVIPDWDEITILNHCKGVSNNFENLQAGTILYMAGHMGVYVGEYKDPSGIVNVIECTSDMGGGVLSSYMDSNGRRYNHKGGYKLRDWERNGRLEQFIEYNKKDSKKKSNKTIAKEVIAGKWGVYPERKKRLESAGYDYAKIQSLVDQMLN